MFTKKVPAYFILISFLVSFSICLGYSYKENLKVNNTEPAYISSSTEYPNSKLLCDLKIARLNGYRFIHPLLYAEPSCESVSLVNFKDQIQEVINTNKRNGNITEASVYVRVFSHAQWVAINPDEKYFPGSLLKVPELIAYYKMEELTPGFLDRKIQYNNKIPSGKQITFESKHIELGKTYTIRELLKYMIVYSDNDATMLLNKMINTAIFKKVFTDLGMKEPDMAASTYLMNVVDFSVFMKILYNSSYLDFKHSEECLNLMSESKFFDGLIAGLPTGCDVVHKFGESGTTDSPNFCESAIVYFGSTPYIITVMTKGKDIKKLPSVIRDIAKTVNQIILKIY